MARVVGNAGESAALRGAKFYGIAAVATALILVVFAVTIQTYVWILGPIGVVLGAIAVMIFVRAARESRAVIADTARTGRNYLKGAAGEARVHAALSALPHEFIVFHDFHPMKGGSPAKWNVDHIVVGPTGVFVLDAKNYSRPRVRSAHVSERSRKNVKQVYDSACELKTCLSKWSQHALDDVFVVPVVVYVQDGATVDKSREDDVRVLTLAELPDEILRHTDDAMNLERAGRVALAMFSQIPPERQRPFKSEIDAYARLAAAGRVTPSTPPAGGSTAGPPVPSVCPRCGGNLVLKTARQGERAGKQFLACANFHTTGCRYGFNID